MLGAVKITEQALRQVQINKKTGTNVAPVERAFLRADPDIIMIGKLRDKEAVSMGFLASLTGHMVFSILHTMSGTESITRQLEIVILAQRLAKK